MSEKNGRVLPRGGTKRDVVLKHLERSAGTTHYLDDLTTFVDSTPGSIQSMMRDMAAKIPQVEIVVDGRAWRWNPNQAKVKAGTKLYEELARTPDGLILVRSEDGEIFQLVRLETFKR